MGFWERNEKMVKTSLCVGGSMGSGGHLISKKLHTIFYRKRFPACSDFFQFLSMDSIGLLIINQLMEIIISFLSLWRRSDINKIQMTMCTLHLNFRVMLKLFLINYTNDRQQKVFLFSAQGSSFRIFDRFFQQEYFFD